MSDGVAPPGAPQRQPENAALRRLVSEFQVELREAKADIRGLAKKLEEMSAEMGAIDVAVQLSKEAHVTKLQLLGMAGAFALVVWAGSFWLAMQTKESVKAVETRLNQRIDDTREGQQETRRDVRAIYDFSRTKKRQERLERPLEREEDPQP